ncbi:TIR domain-containing protein [bacterium]|nr:TIR domain-containing protein [bacterium]
MVDLFLSYARDERARASPLKEALERRGFRPFFDVERIDGGAEFPDVIDAAVKSAKAVIGVWSPHALSRPWVKRECRIGQLRGVLIPVAIDALSELEVPAEFFGTHYIDLRGFTGADDHEGFQQLLRSLDRLLERGGASGGDDRNLVQSAGTAEEDGAASYRIVVTFDEAVLGAVNRVKLADQTIDLKIPAGVDTGSRIRLRGLGPMVGGVKTNVIVEIEVTPDPGFRREGDDVRSDLSISLKEAMDGARIPVRAPGGFVMLTVPSNSNRGDVLRLRGKGVKDKGDLLVRIQLALPDRDNADLKALLRSWPGADSPPLRPTPSGG